MPNISFDVLNLIIATIALFIAILSLHDSRKFNKPRIEVDDFCIYTPEKCDNTYVVEFNINNISPAFVTLTKIEFSYGSTPIQIINNYEPEGYDYFDGHLEIKSVSRD